MVARAQLLELGFHPQAIKRGIKAGRLHPIHRGVYAIGRPDITRYGSWMAAVLSCGPYAALSHESAAALWEVRPPRTVPVEISLPAHLLRKRPGIVVHRKTTLDITKHEGIPVTTIACTLVDLAARLDRAALERAINEADRRDITDPERLRSALEGMPRRPGITAIRTVLDRRTFTLTDSQLEQRFLPLAAAAGLTRPETRCFVNGFRVDFYWRELGLVVETDGLRYHRTPAQQAKDRIRDQAHLASGMTPLRFTHAQVWFERRYVQGTLKTVARRLCAR